MPGPAIIPRTPARAGAGKSTSVNHPSADLADAGEDTCSRFAETPGSRASAATHWRSIPPLTRDSHLPSDESVFATQREWVAGRAETQLAWPIDGRIVGTEVDTTRSLVDALAALSPDCIRSAVASRQCAVVWGWTRTHRLRRNCNSPWPDPSRPLDFVKAWQPSALEPRLPPRTTSFTNSTLTPIQSSIHRRTACSSIVGEKKGGAARDAAKTPP
jgi:hypothetical protein